MNKTSHYNVIHQCNTTKTPVHSPERTSYVVSKLIKTPRETRLAINHQTKVTMSSCKKTYSKNNSLLKIKQKHHYNPDAESETSERSSRKQST